MFSARTPHCKPPMSCMELGHTFEFPASMLAQAEDTYLAEVNQ